MTGARGSAAAQPSLQRPTTVRSGLIVAIPHDDPTTVGIYAMFVSSRARRGGVGRALVEAAIEWATGRDAERVTLMVIDGNEPASKLYESCGFTYFGGVGATRA